MSERRSTAESDARSGETESTETELAEQGGAWPRRSDHEASNEGTYVESDVIITAVRLIVPFSLTYGLFLVFHGADSSGGSFQGGTIIAATILLIAFTFGIDVTREWLANRTVVGLVAGGTVGFVLVGLAPVAFGRNFFEHTFLTEFGIKTKWGLEAAEIAGVAPIVAGAIAGLFFVISAGSLKSTIERTDREVADDD